MKLALCTLVLLQKIKTFVSVLCVNCCVMILSFALMHLNGTTLHKSSQFQNRGPSYQGTFGIAGRHSVAHPVLHSSMDNFAPSIVKKMCCTEIKVLNTPAVKWGRTNETVALHVYTSLMTSAPLPPRLKFPDNICMRTLPVHVSCTSNICCSY